MAVIPAGLARMDVLDPVPPAKEMARRRTRASWHMSGVGGIINIPSNGSDNKLALFASPFRLRKFFRENTFDVIHVHEPPVPSLSYWTAWLTPGVPKMGTFHAFQESPPLGA